nr:hypothetical protein [uncultured Roseateles sp.]
MSSFREAQGLDARGVFLDGLVERGIDGVTLAYTDLPNDGEPFRGGLLGLHVRRRQQCCH